MNRATRIELMRLVHGELSPSAAAELRARIAADAELARELDVLDRQWQALRLPEPQAVSQGFATRVVARATAEPDRALAPVWWSQTWGGKLATGLLLAAGIALGAVLASPSEAEDWSGYLDTEPSMAESYFLAMEQTESGDWQENGS